MGNEKNYLDEGGFTELEYHQVGETLVAHNNVSAKIIEKNDTVNNHEGLPLHSGESSNYLGLDDQTKQITQLRHYESRTAAIDFDWGHPHKDSMPEGIVHVHEWKKTKKGLRRMPPRWMTESEIAEYGPLILLANPNARLRP